MTDLTRLPCRDEEGNVLVVVEVPRGSRVKLEFVPKLGTFRLNRLLPLGFAYPYDWGFVPSTIAEDGDPLDAMVLYEVPTWPGVVIPSRPIGVIRIDEREKAGASRQRNDRVLFVPNDEERYASIDDLPKHVRQDLERFFVVFGETRKTDVRILGWSGPKTATALVDRAAKRRAAP